MKLKVNWDIVGVATSFACAIHCALLPLFLSSLPLFGINIIHNTLFEVFMISLAFAIGSYSLWHGFQRHHHRFSPLLIFALGFIFLVLKQVFHQYEALLLIPAVLLIVSGHFFNYQLCRQANHCHSDDCIH